MSQQKPIATTGRNFVPTLHHDTYPAIDPNRSSCEGQHVFITGASRGIGRATAVAYAKAGAAVIGIGARSDLSEVKQEVQKAATDAGKKVPDVLTFILDIQNQQSVEEAAKVMGEACLWGIDVLVNNAGYLEKFTPLVESDPDEWWKTWEIVGRSLIHFNQRRDKV
ncbi:MAG: hypothetical protein Q9219_001038 [cf. Caloplaca sp. 3 TL-2023]